MQNTNLHIFPTSQLTGDSNTRISEDVKAYILSKFSSLKSKFPNYFTDASAAILFFTTNSFSGMLVADHSVLKERSNLLPFSHFFAKFSIIALTKFFYLCVT
jgi:hypothetical protein